MIILLAPSKTMNFATPPSMDVRPTAPYFAEEAAQIVDTIRQLHDIKTIMNARGRL
jgi:cytoplasmic iron level regulating protein YaaA (DUF328/UPF0246 family)